jgi:hypothetical protein
MKRLLAVLVGILVYASNARGEIKDLYFETNSYTGVQFHPYLTEELPEGEQLTYRILTGYKYKGYSTGKFSTFWDLEVDGIATEKQFRYTSLTTAVGVRIEAIDIFYYHKSEHILERTPSVHFPLTNYIGIRWHLINK